MLEEDDARAVSSESRKAMEAFAAVAPRFAGVASFVSLDWFDNPPDLAMSFGGGKVNEESLPIAVAVRGRVGHHDDAERHGAHLLRGPNLQNEQTVQRFVEEAIRKAGVLAQPPPDHQSWKPLALAAAEAGKEEL